MPSAGENIENAGEFSPESAVHLIARSTATNPRPETPRNASSVGAGTSSRNSFEHHRNEADNLHDSEPIPAAASKNYSQIAIPGPATPAGVATPSTQRRLSKGPATPNQASSNGEAEDVQAIFSTLSCGSEHEIAFLVRHYAETLGPW